MRKRSPFALVQNASNLFGILCFLISPKCYLYKALSKQSGGGRGARENAKPTDKSAAKSAASFYRSMSSTEQGVESCLDRPLDRGATSDTGV